jgi:hypothetical protein
MAEDINNNDQFQQDLTSLEPDAAVDPSTPAVEPAPVVEPEVVEPEVVEEELTIPVPGRRTARGPVKTKLLEEQERILAHQKQKEEEEREAIAQRAEDDERVNEIQNEIDDIQVQIDYANKNGLNSSALQARQKALQREQARYIPAPVVEPEVVEQPVITPEVVKEVASSPELVDAVTTPEVGEAVQVANEIKTERTLEQGQQLAALDEIAEQKEVLRRAQQRLRDEDLELQKIDNNRFWKDKSIPQKIGLALSMFLGGFGGGQNNAVQIVQNAIDRDIKAQNLNNEQALAKRQDAFKRVQMEIDRLDDLTSNRDKKLKLQMAREELN